MRRFFLVILALTICQYKALGQIVPIKDANKPTSKLSTDVDFSTFNNKIELQQVGIEEETIEDDTPFIKVESMPSFLGGDINTFRVWVMQRIKYPEIASENNISGRVLVQFVIERNGTLTNIHILQSPDSSLSNETIRVLKASPRWMPGFQKHRHVCVKYTLPVDFKFVN